jgi:hypothetical protein
MFYAAFSFYPFVSIRACHAEALAKAGDSRAEKIFASRDDFRL